MSHLRLDLDQLIRGPRHPLVPPPLRSPEPSRLDPPRTLPVRLRPKDDPIRQRRSSPYGEQPICALESRCVRAREMERETAGVGRVRVEGEEARGRRGGRGEVARAGGGLEGDERGGWEGDYWQDRRGMMSGRCEGEEQGMCDGPGVEVNDLANSFSHPPITTKLPSSPFPPSYRLLVASFELMISASSLA